MYFLAVSMPHIDTFLIRLVSDEKIKIPENISTWLQNVKRNVILCNPLLISIIIVNIGF